MKNFHRFAACWAWIAVAFFAHKMPAQTPLAAPEKAAGMAYTFNIEKDKLCWSEASTAQDSFIVINLSGGGFYLQLGNDTLHILKNGRTGFAFTRIAGKESIQLSNGKTLPMPGKKGIAISWNKLGEGERDIEDGATITLCKPTGTEAAGKPQTKTNTYYFIPSPEQELEYYQIAGTSESKANAACCAGAQELVFDYAAQCLVPSCDLGDCACKHCRKLGKTKCDTLRRDFRCKRKTKALRYFHPQVGNAVRIRVEGMNPYRDNLVLHYDFSDRNKEGRNDFKAMLDKKGQPDSAQSSRITKKNTSGNKAQGKSIEPSGVQLIPIFKQEMTLFYNEKYAVGQLRPGFIMLCVLHIQENIKNRFDIPAATAELMTAKLNQWLDTSKVDKEQYRAMLKEGIAYYQKIMNYRVASAWLFQVKNSDITSLGFDWYQNGQKLSENPQTFEFFNKGGFTIDYSAGIAINGLVNDAFTTKAETDPNTNSTKYRVIAQRNSTVNIGPVLLAHAYFRYPGTSRFKIGATTGFMTNTRDNDFGLNFLFGGSLLFGSEERFALTGGAVLGKVARLAEGLKAGETDGSLLDAPNTGETTDVPTRDIYKCKWFVGVTYNLGN